MCTTVINANNKQYEYFKKFKGDDPIEISHEEKDLGVIITDKKDLGVIITNKKDLGVIITDKLDVTEQCVKASNKTNAMLGMINRAIKYKTKEVVVKLYKSLVRPHLDYCIQAWCPFKKKYNIIIIYNHFIKMATIAVELYNWHSKTTNDNKLIKTKI